MLKIFSRGAFVMRCPGCDGHMTFFQSDFLDLNLKLIYKGRVIVGFFQNLRDCDFGLGQASL